MTIEIIPYSAFGPLTFDKTTKDECQQLLGEPSKKRFNRLGMEEFEYQPFIIRFNRLTSTVQECTLLPFADAIIDGIKVTWDREFLRSACEHDKSPRDTYGFIVFPTYGIAVTGIHDDDESQLAITVFNREAVNGWIAKSVPFVMSQDNT